MTVVPEAAASPTASTSAKEVTAPDAPDASVAATTTHEDPNAEVAVLAGAPVTSATIIATTATADASSPISPSKSAELQVARQVSFA